MSWDDILGHDIAKRLLQTHLTAGTVASAYLLHGPEGIGKRRLALETAKTLNCLACLPRGGAGMADASRPCDACAVCGQINRLTHPDVHLVMPGGASDQIKIEDSRSLIGRIALRPFSARFQVAILDGADRLTEEAANSLLKALEEPSPHTRFLLLATHLSHCLPTIVSRCQLIRCHPLPREAVQRIVMQAHTGDSRVAEAVARVCGGSASAAIGLAGRWAEYERLLECFADAAPTAWLTQPLPDTRESVTHLLDGMMGWLRDVAVAATGDPEWMRHALRSDDVRRQAATVDLDRCLSTALALVELRESVEQFVSPRLVAALAREQWLSLTTV